MCWFSGVYRLSVRAQVFTNKARPKLTLQLESLIAVRAVVSAVESAAWQCPWWTREPLNKELPLLLGWNPTQLCGDHFINHYKYIFIYQLNNQYNGKNKRVLWWLSWWSLHRSFFVVAYGNPSWNLEGGRWVWTVVGTRERFIRY